MVDGESGGLAVGDGRAETGEEVGLLKVGQE